MPTPKLIIAQNLKGYLASHTLDTPKYDTALDQIGLSTEVRDDMKVELSHRKPNLHFLIRRQAVYAYNSINYRYITLFPRRIATAESGLLKKHFGEWEDYTELTISSFCDRTLAVMGHCVMQLDQQETQGIAPKDQHADEPLARNYADLPEVFNLFQGIIQLELIK